jgi:hypothetical protein
MFRVSTSDGSSKPLHTDREDLSLGGTLVFACHMATNVDRTTMTLERAMDRAKAGMQVR